MIDFVNLHLHDDNSLLDSCTKFNEYVDLAVKYEQKAIACTNHGRIINWTDKKRYCDSVGIKYIHGCEVYLTAKEYFEVDGAQRKVKDNYHTILLARNNEGIKELNSLVSISSTSSHMYYKPRITFDEFLGISDNIISLSACLAGVLSRIDREIKYLSESESELDIQRLSVLIDYRDKLFDKYDYYEVQPHNTDEQIMLNRVLSKEAKARGKKLVATNDVHSLNQYKAECRKILMAGKEITFGEDEYDFDLTFKSGDEMKELLHNQFVLSDEEIDNAIENSVEIANNIELYELDTSIKYPKISDNDEEVFINKVREKLDYKIKNGIIREDEIEQVRNNLNEEYKVFKQVNMITFMLSMSDLICWCKDNGIPVGPARGSVGGSTTAYILDIIDMNPVRWNTIFSRFCNEFRVEIGDIDVDIPGNQRDAVFNHCIETFGKDKTAFVLAIGTVVDKGTIDLIGKALKYDLNEVKEIKKKYEENPEKTRSKYKDIFKYFDGIVNTCISQSRHPAGIVISPITLDDNYGTLVDSDGNRVLQLDMEAVHEVGLAKYDILGLRTVDTIYETYKLIGKPYPKSHEIDWDDQKVWEDMLRSPFGIFQMESPFAFQMINEFKPHSIFDMSLVTAMIRPSGASYRDGLIKKQVHKNPSEEIDELLKNNYGYLVYQEDVIAFLQNVCGLSGGEADNVRRAIGRKDLDRLEKAMPSILEGYCNNSKKPREVAEQEAKEFLKVIEDASSYMFGYNHSIAYCLLGYMCAYLRYYYPLEFITASFNTIESEKDIADCTELAKQMKISIYPPQFRYSRSNYYMDKEHNAVYKGIASIKFLSPDTAEYLFGLRDEKYSGFIDFLSRLDASHINSRQIEILIKLDFFKEFGNSKFLLNAYHFYSKFGSSKMISKDKFGDANIIESIFKRHSRETAKKYVDLDMDAILSEVEEYLKMIHSEDFPIIDKIKWQNEFVGYIDFRTNEEEDRTKLLILYIRKLVSKKTGKVWAYSFETISIGSGKKSEVLVYPNVYEKNPVVEKSVIKVSPYALTSKEFNGRKSWYLNKYEQIVM